MKTLITVILFIIGIYLAGSINAYESGDIIYPDYVHSDTLVVVDGFNLSFQLEHCDGSDSAIDSLLHVYCVPK